jgi:signal transduction histidine kinase
MKHKRTQNFVDTKVQGALLRRILFHWVAFFVVTGMSIILLQAMLSGPDGFTLAERITKEAGEFTLVAIVMVCLFPAFLLDTVRFSNRFVGPVGRLRRYLKQLGKDQNTEHCAFRGNDFWSEMAAEFNDVADLVESQKQEIDRLKTQLGKAGVTARS